MQLHSQLSDTELRKKLRKQEICLGGNKNLKIYGLLNCKSGKRMKKETGFSLLMNLKLYKMDIAPVVIV